MSADPIRPRDPSLNLQQKIDLKVMQVHIPFRAVSAFRLLSAFAAGPQTMTLSDRFIV